MVALPVALAAKATVVQNFVKSIGGALATIGIGDTATDKKRKREAAASLEAALSGDNAALATLITKAFSGTNVKAVRNLSRDALRAYAKYMGGLPIQYAQYATQLGVPTLSPSALAEATRTGTPTPAAPGTVNPTDLIPPASSSVPMGAVVAIAGVLLLVVARKPRRS